VADAVVTASLEHMEGAGKIAINVCMRIEQRVPHASLRTEVNDPLETRFAKESFHPMPIGKVELDEPESWLTFENGEPGFLQLDVIVLVQVIEPNDLIAPLQKTPGHEKADKTRRAGDEHPHDVLTS
jgi:hypothetical protein